VQNFAGAECDAHAAGSQGRHGRDPASSGSHRESRQPAWHAQK
jgi:hypothetical protein